MSFVQWWFVVRREDIITRVTVTPAVCSRLFEFLTSDEKLCEQHLETVAKKKKNQQQGRLVVHVRSATYHALSRTQPKLEGKCVRVGVDALAVVP